MIVRWKGQPVEILECRGDGKEAIIYSNAGVGFVSYASLEIDCESDEV